MELKQAVVTQQCWLFDNAISTTESDGQALKIFLFKNTSGSQMQSSNLTQLDSHDWPTNFQFWANSQMDNLIKNETNSVLRFSRKDASILVKKKKKTLPYPFT